MSSQWTNKYAIMRDLSLAQGCVPVDIQGTLGAQDKPPAMDFVEETEESFFKHYVADGEFMPPDLGLIRSMLDMVRGAEDVSDTEDQKSSEIIQVTKLNPLAPGFVPSKVFENSSLQLRSQNKKIQPAAGDYKNLQKNNENVENTPELVTSKPKFVKSETKIVSNESKLKEYVNNKRELVKSGPKLVTSSPESVKSGSNVINESNFDKTANNPKPVKDKLLNKKPMARKVNKNVAMASFLESIGVDQSPKLKADKKDNIKAKHDNIKVLMKPNYYEATKKQEQPHKSPIEKVTNWLEHSSTNDIEKPDNTPKKSVKKGLFLIEPSSMFKKKSVSPKDPSPNPITSASQTTKSKENFDKIETYKPSQLAEEYYKMYTERINMQVMLNEDVWARAERQMKEIDERRKLELLKFQASLAQKSSEKPSSNESLSNEPSSIEPSSNEPPSNEPSSIEPSSNEPPSNEPSSSETSDTPQEKALDLVLLPQHRHLLTGDCMVCEVLCCEKRKIGARTINRQNIQ